jgi:hypothetical protein
MNTLASALGILSLSLLTGCGNLSGSLGPVTGGPQRIRLDQPKVVQAGKGLYADGAVHLPAGTYTAVGQDAHGIFYAAPGGVTVVGNLGGATVGPSGVTSSSSRVGLGAPGGVCVHPPGSSRTVISFATWRANVFSNPNKPVLLLDAEPPVEFVAAP